jgi:hypothetical protein
VQKLHLVGFTTDQQGLILSARRGARSGSFQLQIDDALADAVDELRARQAEEAEAEEAEAELARPQRVESALPVREIQARLRQGRSVQEVAKAAGVEPDWVERFAAPVFAERDQVIGKVQGMALRRARLGPSSHAIGDAVRRNLAERGVAMSPEEFTDAWTTRQLADGRWAVRFTYRHRNKDHGLRFDLDDSLGTVTAADRVSGQLGYVAPPTSEGAAPERPRSAKAPADGRPTAKRATVTTGYRPEPGSSAAVSSTAKERERAAAAMRKAAAKAAVDAERAATRKAKERAAAAVRREREAKAAEARRLRERAAAERAKADAERKKAAAAKKVAAERARRKAAQQAAAQAKRAEAALVAAERAAAKKAAKNAAKRAAKETGAKAMKKPATTRSSSAARVARPAVKKARPTSAPARQPAARTSTPTAAPKAPVATRATKRPAPTTPVRKASVTRAPARNAPVARAAIAEAPVDPTPTPTAPVAAPVPAPVPVPVPAMVRSVFADDGHEPAAPRPMFRPGLAEPVGDGGNDRPALVNGVAQPRPVDRPRRTRPLRAT